MSLQYDQAIDDCDQAITIATQFGKSYLAIIYDTRGGIFEAKGQYDKAVINYNQAIAFNPNYSMAYFNKANLYKRLGQNSKATENYQKFLAIAPSVFSQEVSIAKQMLEVMKETK